MFGFLRSRQAAPAVVAEPTTPTVGCFGKLPIQAEYIKHNVAQRAVRELDAWFQNGLVLTARGSVAEPHAEASAPPAHHAVFGGADEQRPVLFSVVSSRDRSGRRYPFVVFQLPGSADRDLSGPVVPLCFEAFFRAAADMLAQPWRNEPLDTVIGWVDRIPPGHGPLTDSLASLSVPWLLDALYPDEPGPRRMAHLDRTVELLRQVERRTAPRVPWGLRLPLERERPARTVCWWLSLAERVLGRRAWRPCYLWTDGGATEPPGLLLFFRAPPMQVVTHVMQGHGLNGAVVDPFDDLAVDPAADAERPHSGTARTLMEQLVARRRA